MALACVHWLSIYNCYNIKSGARSSEACILKIAIGYRCDISYEHWWMTCECHLLKSLLPDIQSFKHNNRSVPVFLHFLCIQRTSGKQPPVQSEDQWAAKGHSVWYRQSATAGRQLCSVYDAVRLLKVLPGVNSSSGQQFGSWMIIILPFNWRRQRPSIVLLFNCGGQSGQTATFNWVVTGHFNPPREELWRESKELLWRWGVSRQ